jgi:hypothetical protein
MRTIGDRMSTRREAVSGASVAARVQTLWSRSSEDHAHPEFPAVITQRRAHARRAHMIGQENTRHAASLRRQ